MGWLTRRDPRVRDELQYHRDRLVDDYMVGGTDRASAERRALLEFGNVAGLEESVRDARGRWWADFRRDLRYALRTLRRSRALALAASLWLAQGMGASAGIFSVINAGLLRRVTFCGPGRPGLI